MTSTTNTALPIFLPLADGHRYAHNRILLRTALNAGWISVTYRKADGTVTERMATCNPSIIGAFGTRYEVDAVQDHDEYDPNIVYFDHSAGTLRSFRVDSVINACIPFAPPEFHQ